MSYPEGGGEVIRLAARELAEGLARMLSEAVEAAPDGELSAATLRVGRGTEAEDELKQNIESLTINEKVKAQKLLDKQLERIEPK
ncbi:MAG TPA: hypothetical protein VJN94_05895, partial [Candidatus Binataceae bacterium]|nr:hypothetical protein [Candidatus Binataceae bacterium]